MNRPLGRRRGQYGLVFLALLPAACSLPKKVLVGAPGEARWVDRAEPQRHSNRDEPTFCTVKARMPVQHYHLIKRTAFRDIRLLTRQHPGPQGCEVLLSLGRQGGDLVTKGSSKIQAFSAYTRELVWEGESQDGSDFDGYVSGIELLGPHLQGAFQPGQEAFQRLSAEKDRGTPPTVEDIEGLAGMGLVAESDDWRKIFPIQDIKFGKARKAEVEPRAAAPPVASEVQAAPVERRPSSDVDEVPLKRSSVNGHAVIIGIERYREKLPKADFAAADARTMARYAAGVLGYPEQNIALLVDESAARSDFEKHLERWLSNRVGKDEEVFVYFSGHGAPNAATGDAYLVPYDGDPTYLDETGYPLKRLFAVLAKLPTRKITVALDSCFSGTGGRSVLARGARPLVTVTTGEASAGITVISAAAASQISNAYHSQGHGLFTYFLLKGLQRHGRDLREAFDFLKPQVEKVARQDYNSDQVPQWRESR